MLDPTGGEGSDSSQWNDMISLANFDPEQPHKNCLTPNSMSKNFLQSRNLLTLAVASAAVSFVLVLVGIFYLAEMKSPTQGMNYGLTPEMLSNPVLFASTLRHLLGYSSVGS